MSETRAYAIFLLARSSFVTIWDRILSTSQPGHEATGTSFYPGGVTTINEQGDEMIELPTGSKIYPARESGRMYQQMQGGMYNIFNVSEVVIREEEFEDV